MGIGQFQLSAEFSGALAHSSDADTGAAGPQLYNPFDHAFPVILHFNDDLVLSPHQGDSDFPRPGMAKDVGQRFLNDAKHCRLQFGREPGKIGWLHFERGFDAAALGQSVQVPAQGGDQAHFIEQGRMQKMGQAANLLRGMINQAVGFADLAFQQGRILSRNRRSSSS